jgi:hypothetical protein
MILSDGSDLATSCFMGILNSPVELMKFMQSSLYYLTTLVVEENARDKLLSNGEELSQSVGLYFYTEYEKAKEIAPFPKEMNGLIFASRQILKNLFHEVQHYIKGQKEKFFCYNASTQSKMTCQLLADVMIPPAALFKFLKNSRDLKKVAKLTPDDPKMAEELAKKHLRDVSSSLSMIFDREKLIKEFSQDFGCDLECASRRFKELENIQRGQKISHIRLLNIIGEGRILYKPQKNLDRELLNLGFKKINTCIKQKGECLRLPNGEAAPMSIYVHESGIAMRVKSKPVPGQIRENPHASMMIFTTEGDFKEKLMSLKSSSDAQKFSDQYLGWNKELAKIDPKSGVFIPKSPNFVNTSNLPGPKSKAAYIDAIMDRVHVDLNN